MPVDKIDRFLEKSRNPTVTLINVTIVTLINVTTGAFEIIRRGPFKTYDAETLARSPNFTCPLL